MYILSILLILMLASALCLLFLPVVNQQGNSLSSSHLVISLLIIGCACTLYLSFSNPSALAQWLKEGKQHYELLVEYDQLGGIDGIIAKIKQKLAQNPADKKGWMILGKLYQSKNDPKSADEAFAKAK